MTVEERHLRVSNNVVAAEIAVPAGGAEVIARFEREVLTQQAERLEGAVLQLGLWLGMEKLSIAVGYSGISEEHAKIVRTFTEVYEREVALPPAARLLRQAWGIEE